MHEHVEQAQEPATYVDVAWKLPATRGNVPSEYAGETYYGIPAIKASHYGWRAGAAFFSEGVGGAAQYIATTADLFGNEEQRPLVRAGRYVALGGALVTPVLFVIDLHVRQRWYKMLRMFRPTSAMSIGTWSLSEFGLFTALTAFAQAIEDHGLRRTGRLLGRIFQIPASLAGAVSSFYMGTELEETSTPVWAASFPHLPELFACANASLAAATLATLGQAQGMARDKVQRVQRISTLTGAWALSVLGEISKGRSLVSHAGSMREPDGRPLLPFMLKVMSIFRLLRVVRKKRLRTLSMPRLGARLAFDLLARGLLLRAGNASARDPKKYFSLTQPENGDRYDEGKAMREKGGRRLTWGFALVALGAYIFSKMRKEEG